MASRVGSEGREPAESSTHPQIGETKIWSGSDTVPKRLRVQRQILKHTPFQNSAVGVMIIGNEHSAKGMQRRD